MIAPAELARACAAMAPRPTPALVWHGADGERIELSGRVAENWIAKSASLLLEEFSPQLSTLFRIRLSSSEGSMVHWRGLLIGLGAVAAGGSVLLAGPGQIWDDTGGEADEVVDIVTAGSAQTDADDRIDVALPGLAMTAGAVPGLDYNREVRSHPDVYAHAAPSPRAAEDPSTGLLVDITPDPAQSASGGLPAAAWPLILGALEHGRPLGFSDMASPHAVMAREGITAGIAERLG